MVTVSEEIKIKREKLFREMLDKNLGTFFTTFHMQEAPKYGLVTQPVFYYEPRPLAGYYKWNYKEARDYLYKLAEVLTAEEAERRTIHYINPKLKSYPNVGPVAALPTLYAGIQLVKPGELAWAHRHTPNAFRLALECPKDGGYTVVNGFKLIMHTGDVILTPSWAWHDHRNDSNEDLIWYDGLDAPLHAWVGSVFYEDYIKGDEKKAQDIIYSAEEINLTYGSALLPNVLSTNTWNPVLHYPYSRTKETLTKLAEKTPASPHDGIYLKLVNPITGGSTFPTMMLGFKLYKPGVETKPLRRAENVLITCIEGEGIIEIEDGKEKYSIIPFDTVAIPPWVKYRIVNTGKKDLIVFTQSDEPIFRLLQAYREWFG
jgi:gentisate 1,2-dioxygenase